MIEITIAALLVACLVAVSDWKRGMFLVIFVAFLQDPLRKVVPDQPAYFILLCGIVFGAALLGALRVGVPLGPTMVIGWRRYMSVPFQLFVLVVLLQAFHSFVRFGNPMVSALGLISYLAPFLALALSHAFAATVGTRGIERFLLVYVVCAFAALLTLYLQSAGVEWPILGEVGEGIRIHDLGGVLTAYSGTFRASEIAAWHAAMCASVVFLLMTWRKMTANRVVLALLLMGLIVGLGVLTGRRKFLVMIAVFLSVYIGLLGVFWDRARSVAIPAFVIGFLGYISVLLTGDPEAVVHATSDQEYELYVQRATSVFGDVNERFVQLGLAPVMWAYNWFGLLGGGAGIGTQGVQHMTQVGEHIGAAEGGLGKIMLELGLPGLLAVLALGWATVRHVRLLLQQIARASAAHLRLSCALIAILPANLASFSIATQAFGDIFILLFIGTCLGALLAMPRIINRELGTIRSDKADLVSIVRPATI